jgi:hypothetical protein
MRNAKWSSLSAPDSLTCALPSPIGLLSLLQTPCPVPLPSTTGLLSLLANGLPGEEGRVKEGGA